MLRVIIFCGAVAVGGCWKQQAANFHPVGEGEGDADADTDVDGDADTDTEPGYCDEEFQSCYFSPMGDGGGHWMVGIHANDDGTVVASTSTGRIIRLDTEGEVVSDFYLTSTADEFEIGAMQGDGTGGFVVTGSFFGDAVFAQGESGETLLTSGENKGLFIARYDGSSELVWIRKATGNTKVQGAGLGIFPDGSIVMTGLLRSGAVDSTITLGAGEPNSLAIFQPSDPHHIGPVPFIARLGSDGSPQWAYVLREGRLSREVATYPDGSFALSGTTSASSLVLGEGLPGETEIEQSGLDFPPADSESFFNESHRYMLFFARYNQDGSLMWVRQAESYGLSGNPLSPVVSDDGSLVFSGNFSLGLCTLDEGTILDSFVSYYEETMGGYEFGDAGLVVRYTSEGDYVYAVASTCYGSEHCFVNYSNPVALTNGRVAAAAVFRGSVLYGLGEAGPKIMDKDGVVSLVYNDNGELEYQASLEEELDFSIFRTKALSKAPDDGLVLGGTFKGSYDVSLSDGSSVTGAAETDEDLMVIKLCPEF